MPIPFFTVLLLGIALSMDAFAISISRGFSVGKGHFKEATELGLAFGFFQGLMPQIGWMLGRGLEKIVTEYDHWVAFVLLVLVGSKMIYEAIKEDDECELDANHLSLRTLVILGIATSIDALVVGVSFSFIPVTIIVPVIIIGIITFLISFAGVFIGKLFGRFLGPKAEIMGGIILIGVGFHILFSHLYA